MWCRKDAAMDPFLGDIVFDTPLAYAGRPMTYTVTCGSPWSELTYKGLYRNHIGVLLEWLPGSRSFDHGSCKNLCLTPEYIQTPQTLFLYHQYLSFPNCIHILFQNQFYTFFCRTSAKIGRELRKMGSTAIMTLRLGPGQMSYRQC